MIFFIEFPDISIARFDLHDNPNEQAARDRTASGTSSTIGPYIQIGQQRFLPIANARAVSLSDW
ncbi:hypothetical protein [Pacificimonas aurantium]|uniref:Uncharacterized protein n=1 Tax=Pacificimonas aurantium TaxID=1250540 RepID=A0ABS7WHK7_9SPHN|nr:hypothetical protein [Pacificimonas aurantium]MBZ6377873.1 hypothetical protein [Pacificimonas aurantium]